MGMERQDALVLGALLFISAPSAASDYDTARTEAARKAYAGCVVARGAEFSLPEFTPSEVADAAIGKCEPELRSYELAANAYLLGATSGGPSNERRAIRQSQQLASDLRARYRRQIIQLVIEHRVTVR